MFLQEIPPPSPPMSEPISAWCWLWHPFMFAWQTLVDFVCGFLLR